MKYARVTEDNVVAEIFYTEGETSINEYFHPDLVVFFEQVGEDVQQGWTKDDNGGFVEPPKLNPGHPGEIPSTTI